jgi:hypothetical protein
VADSITMVTWGGSMMITSSHTLVVFGRDCGGDALRRFAQTRFRMRGRCVRACCGNVGRQVH